jgi:hypothetical protein
MRGSAVQGFSGSVVMRFRGSGVQGFSICRPGGANDLKVQLEVQLEVDTDASLDAVGSARWRSRRIGRVRSGSMTIDRPGMAVLPGPFALLLAVFPILFALPLQVFTLLLSNVLPVCFLLFLLLFMELLPLFGVLFGVASRTLPTIRCQGCRKKKKRQSPYQ